MMSDFDWRKQRENIWTLHKASLVLPKDLYRRKTKKEKGISFRKHSGDVEVNETHKEKSIRKRNIFNTFRKNS